MIKMTANLKKAAAVVKELEALQEEWGRKDSSELLGKYSPKDNLIQHILAI
jgi:hypothetical protein